MSLDLERPEWQAQARCRGMDTELFFALEPKAGRAIRDLYAKARRVCACCPVRVECLIWGLKDGYGVFGGLSPLERQLLRNDSDRIRSRLGAESVARVEAARELLAERGVSSGEREPSAIHHGTPGGTQAHYRRDEQACQACKDASNSYHNEWKAQRASPSS